MLNSGIIEDPRSQYEKSLDYIAGAETPIKYEIRLQNGDWSYYLPTEKKQTLSSGRDTNACTHFAVMQAIEVQLNLLFPSLPDTHKQFLQSNGYMVGSKVSLSPRFSAITGGNTIKGNYFHKVWDTTRKVGVIPEQDLPMGGTTWSEYHDPEVITQDMRDKALKFLEHFEIKYDFVAGYDNAKGFNQDELSNNLYLLKQCPLNIGVPIPVNHAIIMTRNDGQVYDSFDHYTPFHRVNDQRGVGFALRGVVTILEPNKPISKPIYYFTKDMKLGDRGEEVKALQECLIYLGLLKAGLNTGYFGPITKNAVIKFQESQPELLKKAGITHGTGLVRSITRGFLNNLFKK